MVGIEEALPVIARVNQLIILVVMKYGSGSPVAESGVTHSIAERKMISQV